MAASTVFTRLDSIEEEKINAILGLYDNAPDLETLSALADVATELSALAADATALGALADNATALNALAADATALGGLADVATELGALAAKDNELLALLTP